MSPYMLASSQGPLGVRPAVPSSRLQCQTARFAAPPRSTSRSRAASLRFGFLIFLSRPPIEGWAERRQAHFFCCRAGEARPIRTRRGAARPMTRDARLSALHRGDFRPGAALPSPALPPDPYSELLAARSSCLAGGVPDLPSPRLRAAAAGRHSPLRLQDRLRKTTLMSEDANLLLYIHYVVKL